MKIVRHRLCDDEGNPVPYVRSPNVSGKVEPEYLVIHYTAGRTTEGAISWLTNRDSRASAHLVIGRDGQITQLVPFDRVAWHAGYSHWEGRTGLNRYSLGIELDNAGRLTRRGDRWRSWFQHEYGLEEVLEAEHKHGRKGYGWHVFPPRQIEITLEVAQLLVTHYGLRDVVGHDDISPKRKWDPGPAFPMESFRSRIVGRAEEKPILYETKVNLNIRTGAGTQHPTIPGSPLPKGTPVEVVSEEGSWRLVDVLVEVREIMDMQGWVHGRYLQRSALTLEDLAGEGG